ncbi:hypothetical protein [Roseisalinus antarcticus]|uniref:NADH dehydrogenase subunit E n=1 Tax=Roseisalinus antarcticus TaxID=254357 RepID=A0A1Y5SJU4_9RHOB|nr:hypothetical protein [Roseisalinus antarcticus]SLN41260.1 NADH dehydrogenase subunit E [Roseisalinus antarcticus]
MTMTQSPVSMYSGFLPAGAAMSVAAPMMQGMAAAFAFQGYAWRMAMAGPLMMIRGSGMTATPFAPFLPKTAPDAKVQDPAAIDAFAEQAVEAVAAMKARVAEIEASLPKPEAAAAETAQASEAAPKVDAAPPAVEAEAPAAEAKAPEMVAETKSETLAPAPAPEAKTPAVAPEVETPAPAAGPEARKPAAAPAPMAEAPKDNAPAPAAETRAESPVPAAARKDASEGTATMAPVRPPALDAPRGTSDDLTMLPGVGTKLAEKLAGFGIYHFDQIAAWSDAEVAWMDENLGGPAGRVTRGRWVAAAAALSGPDGSA